MFPKNYLFPYIIIVASIIYPPKFMYFIQSTFIQAFTIYIIPALMQTEDNGHNISIVILMNYANRGEEKHARTTTQIPVGYIFKPSDHELIIDYLTRKIASYPLPSNVFVEIDAVDFFDKHPAKLVEGNHGWDHAHATFYGDIGGQETMEGACGYEDLFKQGYGLETTALSTALFKDGATCGACFQIKCKDSKWCKKDAGSIRVTATNYCPPWYQDTPDAWCNPPRKHFDLSMKMFLKIAQYEGGIVPVMYRRVKCHRQGGVKFELKGNSYWLLVLVYNVAGDGDVVGVNIKGSSSSWSQMSRNWGQNWQIFQKLEGQSLSFQVTTSDGKKMEFDDVVPANWQFDKTYESNRNFH